MANSKNSITSTEAQKHSFDALAAKPGRLMRLAQGGSVDEAEAAAVLAALEQCTDEMPDSTCDHLALPCGSSYAHGVAHVRKLLDW